MTTDAATESFTLDPRLQVDTLPVLDLPLSRVLLMDDARYPWLVLVPRIATASEWHDLDPLTGQRLFDEVMQAGAALRAVTPCDKLNIGALGNIVRQLHVHVVARTIGDAAWPGPVWGHGRAERRNPHDLESLRRALAARLAGN